MDPGPGSVHKRPWVSIKLECTEAREGFYLCGQDEGHDEKVTDAQVDDVVVDRGVHGFVPIDRDTDQEVAQDAHHKLH